MSATSTTTGWSPAVARRRGHHPASRRPEWIAGVQTLRHDDSGATTKRSTTASQIGNPPPGEPVPAKCPQSQQPDRSPAAARRPRAASSGPAEGSGRPGSSESTLARRREVMRVEFPVPVKPVYSSPDLVPGVDGQRPPVVVAGTVKKYTASKSRRRRSPRWSRRRHWCSTGRRRRCHRWGEGELGAGHRVEAREEVARVGWP